MVLLLLPRPAAASIPQVVVEVTGDAARVVDVRFTRRMLQIELGDLKPRESEEPLAPGEDQSLYFRVLLVDAQTLVVELWNRGNLLGKRSISVSKGSPQLHSRRIVLAAAELARRAPAQMRAQIAREEETTSACSAAQRRAAFGERLPRLRLDAFGEFSTISLGEAWLAGVGLRPTVQWNQRSTLAVGFSMLQGRFRDVTPRPYLRWFEASISPGHEWPLSTDWLAGLSLSASFATVFIRGGAQDDSAAQTPTQWSARSMLAPTISHRVAGDVWLGLAPLVGWTLRKVPIAQASNESRRLGGSWIGASLNVSVGSRHE